MRRPVLLALLSAAALTVPAAAAHAQDAPPPAPPPPAAPAAPAQPAPAQPEFKLSAEHVGGGGAVLASQRFRVRGVVTPYVPGQKATVRFYRGRGKLRVKSVSLLPSSTGRSGYFVLGFRSRSAGRVTIRASHLATAQLGTVVAKPVTVSVLPRRAGPGSRGPAVRLLQAGLARLGYVVGRRGRYDARTGRAVLAFRKSTGLARTTIADARVFRKLAAGAGRFQARFPSHGRHVESDLSKQVIALIGAGGRVERIYPASTGKPSTPTILGSFHFYSKTPGTNSEGMVFSNYFIRGYAIHGYVDVPPYAASHGCLRVPIPDAVAIYRWIRLGEWMDVYR